jgi:hypothetical protein
MTLVKGKSIGGDKKKKKKRVQRRAHDLKNQGADQRNRVQRRAHDLKNQDASLGSKPRSNSKIQFASNRSKFVHVNLDPGPSFKVGLRYRQFSYQLSKSY